MKILAVNGSMTPGLSRTRTAIDVALASSVAAGASASVLELRDANLQFCDGRAPHTYEGDTLDALHQLDEADAYIFATPIYRGTYSGALKNYLDLVPNGQEGWDPLRGKLVALIATGGSLRHFMTIDHGLRPMFAFFGAHTLSRGVFLTPADYDADKHPVGGALDELHLLGQELVRLAPAFKG